MKRLPHVSTTLICFPPSKINCADRRGSFTMECTQRDWCGQPPPISRLLCRRQSIFVCFSKQRFFKAWRVFIFSVFFFVFVLNTFLKMYSVQKTFTSKAVEHFENFSRQTSSTFKSNSSHPLQKSRSEVLSDRGYKPSDVHNPQAREYLNNLTKRVFHTVRRSALFLDSHTIFFFFISFVRAIVYGNFVVN